MKELMIFLGLVVLTSALFTYSHPVLRRLGLLCIGLTTFSAGYLPTGNVWVGLACGSVWLLLPWVEILLRVRKLRLPLRKELQQAAPPSRSDCPGLGELSDEIEEAGFEHVADLGWEMEGYRQFLRLFANPTRREEAAITFVNQNELGFYFASVTSRSDSGGVFTTWNCPVSSSLKTAPGVYLNRVASDEGFASLVRNHETFLALMEAGDLREVQSKEVRALVEHDMATQIEHNLQEGLLQPTGEGHGRYSWRGMLYLWFQFLRDIFRFS